MPRKPKPAPAQPKRNFYSDSTVQVIGDSVCLTFHRAQGDDAEGDAVEVWLPLSSAGTAAMALLEESFGARLARTVLGRANYVAYKAWLKADPERKPQDWERVGL